MAYVWSKDLETGNAMIDSQHKELIEAINALLCWRREITTIFCRAYLTNFCRKSRSQQNK